MFAGWGEGVGAALGGGAEWVPPASASVYLWGSGHEGVKRERVSVS